MNRTYMRIVLLLCLLQFASCSQSQTFDFEQDIRTAFDQNGDDIYFSFNEDTAKHFLFSDVLNLDLNILDSILQPKQNSKGDLQASPDESLTNSHITYYNQGSQQYKLHVGDMVFVVDVDFRTGKLNRIYTSNWYNEVRENCGFEFNRNGELIRYKAYRSIDSRFSNGPTVNPEEVEKRYYYVKIPGYNEVDKGGSEKDMEEMRVLGQRIQKIISQLVLAYKLNCKDEYPKIETDSISLKQSIDSVLSEMKDNPYVNFKGIELKNILQQELTIRIDFRILPNAAVEQTRITVFYLDEIGKRADFRYEVLNSKIESKLREHLHFNVPRLTGIPVSGSKRITIQTKNGMVTNMVF